MSGIDNENVNGAPDTDRPDAAGMPPEDLAAQAGVSAGGDVPGSGDAAVSADRSGGGDAADPADGTDPGAMAGELDMSGGSTYHIDRLDKRPSVQSKIVALLVPTIAAVVALMVVFTRSYSMDILERNIEELLQSESRGVVNEVKAWTGSIFAGLEAQKRALEFMDAGPEEELAFIRSTIDPNSSYPDGIFIAMEDGSYIFSKWQPDEDYDPRQRGWYREGLEHKRFTFGTPYRDMITGRVLITATCVLRDSSGQVRGVAAGDVHLGEVSKIVSGVQLEQTGGAFIVDSETMIVLGAGNTARTGVAISEIAWDPVFAPVERWVREGALGLQSAGAGGKIMYYFLEQVPGSSWVSVIFVPKAEVMDDAQRMTLMAIVIAVMGILALSVITHVLIRRTIVMPVENLDYAVYRIAEGELDVPIDICSDDEFGRMAENLGRTTGRLYMYIDYIDELTRALDEIGNGNLDVRPELEYEGEFTKIRDAVVSIAEKLKLAEEQEMIARRMEREKEAADAANKAKGRFLAQMSHEIRTPINAVLGMNEMILNEAEDEQILDYASNIDFAGRQLLSIINTILDFSKIEDGKMEIVPANYDLASVINNLVNGAVMRARTKSLTFTAVIDETLPCTVYGDDVRVTQVIQNIMTNAIKYTEKGSVTFTVRNGGRDGEDVFLDVSVKDTGIGIRQEDMGKLFASFERLDTQRNRHIEGTGLGMGIVVNLLKMMGSKIEVDSVYGEGSDFHFRLRQRVVDDRPIGNYTERLASSGSRRERDMTLHAPEARVLVVDDNAMNLKVAKNLLKMNSVVPDLAKSGAEAIQMIRENSYDIVLMDHMMPVMDGIETLKVLQKEELIRPGMSVLVLTANAVTGAREEYLKAGFVDYLSKPISVDELSEKLVKYLPGEKVTWRRRSDGKKDKPAAGGKESPAAKTPAAKTAPAGTGPVRAAPAMEEVAEAAARAKAAATVAASAPMRSAAPAEERPEAPAKAAAGPGAPAEEPLEFGPEAEAPLEFGPEAEEPLEFGPEAEEPLEFGPGADEPLEFGFGDGSGGGPGADGDAIERVAAIGLNTGSGLQYCSGDPDFYLELLGDFTHEHDEKAGELRGFYESKDWDGYRIRIHALKSVAKTIGAGELFEQARDLESAAADVDVVFLSEHHEPAMQLYQRISDGIAEALGE